MSAYMNGTKTYASHCIKSYQNPEIRVEVATSKNRPLLPKIENAEAEMRAVYKNGASEEERRGFTIAL